MNGKVPQKIEISVRTAVDVKTFTVEKGQYTFDTTTNCYRVWNDVTTIVVPILSLVYIHILT